MTESDASITQAPPPRRGTDWIAARDIWLALDPPRSFGVVARQFGVSDTRVRFVARRDNWQKLAEEIDAEAAEQAKRAIVKSRAERVKTTLRIVDGLLDHFDENLAAKAAEAKFADLPGIVKLAELLEGEATDRVSIGEVQEVVRTVFLVAGRYVPKARREDFKRDLEQALGGLPAIATAAAA